MPNLLNLGVSAVVANSITQGAFNAGLIDFFTGGDKMGSDGTFKITLPEVLFRQGGNYASGWDFQRVVMANIKKNGMSMIGTIILAPMVANVLKKSLAKPVIRPMNRLLKDSGLNVKVA